VLAFSDDSIQAEIGNNAQRARPTLGKDSAPFIVTGGELTLAGLDLVFDDVNKYYEASFSGKANGVFCLSMILVANLLSRDLLNRWIVPLRTV
jgi:hypothetical protein